MDVKTVSQLTRSIKYHLNSQFPATWVSGEISEITQPRSGHVYFTLKDQHAQINAILWRSDVQQLKFELKSGMKVLCRGGVDVYPQRGTYQLIVRKIQPEGMGARELALRQLKEKLTREGVFDLDKKRALPAIPRHIAVITSPDGAAVHDFLQVLLRRWSLVRVTIVPAQMQGAGSVDEVVSAVNACQQMQEKPDVIVLTRGGGSVEDLWTFNEERVVRAIHASSIPIITGIGHEIDVTLSDHAADVRALTPSEAAERVVPELDEVRAGLDMLLRRLRRSVLVRYDQAQRELQDLASRPSLTKPLERVHQHAMQLDFLEQRMNAAFQRVATARKQQIVTLAGRLEAMNPLAVLARGYSLTTLPTGQLLTDCENISVGDTIATRVANGQLTCRVEDIQKASETGGLPDR